MYRYRAKVTKIHTANLLSLEIDLGFNIKKDQQVNLNSVRPNLSTITNTKDGSRILEFINSWVEEHSKNKDWPFVIDVYKEDHNSPYNIELYAINDPMSLNELLMNEGWGD